MPAPATRGPKGLPNSSLWWSIVEIAQDGTPPQIYSWAGNASNLEANWKSWDFRGVQSLEEFAVASLLWDLLDPADAKDKTVLTQLGVGGVQTAAFADRLEIPLPTLWSYLAHNRGGAYGYNLHVQHLYEVLKANGVGAAASSEASPEPGAAGLTALDELFVAHGFFADTGPHLNFFDAGETVGTTGYLSYTVTISPTKTVEHSCAAAAPVAAAGAGRLREGSGRRRVRETRGGHPVRRECALRRSV